MMVETPIEILHVPDQLRSLFTGKLAEATSGTPHEREANFLSRALAAYALHKLGKCSIEEAVSSIVDGGGDGGIDAVFYANTQTLWVVQSKFISTGRGEPDLGSVSKFKEGLENLLQGKFDAFSSNAVWKTKLSTIQLAVGKWEQVRAVLIYSGINLISEDRRRMFESLKQRFCIESDDYLEFYSCNLTTIHSWLIGTDKGLGVPELELTILNPGYVKKPYETIFGLLPIADLSNIFTKHGKQIVAANIRAYKGKTDVNDRILATIQDEPHHFFYLNNGITAYCQRLKINNFDLTNYESKRIIAYSFSIVNGAQTLGSIVKFFDNPKHPKAEGYVFIKIISLQKCEDEREFADRITYSTNFQNQIGLRDFVALDEQQEIIANQLKLSGISYHYKADVDTPAGDENNFTLEEATTALACLIQSSDCDFCARILGNWDSLWSKEEVYPEGDPLRSYYSRVFRPEHSARTVWRAVQTTRIVIKAMQDSGTASTGVRKTFFENARWLVLNVLFLKLHPERGDDLALTDEHQAEISRYAVELAEALWEVCEERGYVSRKPVAGGTEIFECNPHFRSVFSTASHCQVLRNGLLAKLR